MATFYILDPNAPTFSVWNHRMGAFARDFDAEYNPALFGYTSYSYALKRAGQVMADRKLNEIEVVSRETLFRRFDIQDWAKYD